MFYFDERRRVALTANNSETIALLNYAIGKSIAIPNEQTINALDAFYNTAGVGQLISDKMDLYYHFVGAGTSAFKLLNAAKKNNSWDGTGFGGLTWSAAGVTGNGTNAYIDTNFNPSLIVAGQKYQLNNASRGSVLYTLSGSNSMIDGLPSSVDNSFFVAATNQHRINGATLNTSADLTGTGLKAIVRDAAGVKLYNKNVTMDREQAATALSNATQTVFARNGLYSTHSISSYFMGGALTFSETQLIRTATNAQLAALGLSQIA